ncbi:DoxX family protein [Rhizohabitans arisaemae]|uniref:DoxX family protein n=1 Tax=Rhizohabitans arisaemae TaxID=2720610 RepID=UPI0024B07AD0|nr:DoxX family protein [Rhizohabitans arisaemae]
MDAALLLLRVVLGIILVCHAAQKSLGWFRGPGLNGSAIFFESLGHRPGRIMTILAAVCELTAGTLFLLGLFTPLAAAVAGGTMLVAGLSMIAKAGVFWNVLGGGEYPFVLAMLCIALGLSGPGAWSLDAVLFNPWPPAAGIAAAVLAVVSAALAMVNTRIARKGQAP